MTQFLPPISATTRVSWRAPAGSPRGRAHELQADGARAGERDRRDVRGGSASAAPVSPAPGSSAIAPAGTPPARSASTSASAQPGACSAGLSTAVLPVASAAAVMPSGMARGKFQGEMTAVTPRGGVAQRVALAGDLHERGAALELDRAPRVVLEEVDRLADVRIGLRPGLGALADGERGELGAAQRAGGRRRGRARLRAPARACATSAAERRARRRPRGRPRRACPSPRWRRPGRVPPGRWRRAPPRRGGRPRSTPAPAAAGGHRARRAHR